MSTSNPIPPTSNRTTSRRLKVLISAYACEPGRGSEPGVGWNISKEMANHHDIWVLTRSNNREVIETELAKHPVPGLNFFYYDLPKWAMWWKKGGRGVQLYYYLWQLAAISQVRKKHAEIGFDLCHHATFIRVWSPSVLRALSIPFLWGPVGGAETTPSGFSVDFGAVDRAKEFSKEWILKASRLDPFLRKTVNNADVAVGTTTQSVASLKSRGVENVKLMGESGLSAQEINKLIGCSSLETSTIRFICMGRLLHWKGFQMAIRGFAKSGLSGSELWICGDGPYRGKLESLSQKLGVSTQVYFFGQLDRSECLKKLKESHVLVHPSLHDSGGWVCLEAMAGRHPVICLDHGGPGYQVTPECGFKITTSKYEETVQDIASAMRQLAENRELREQMGEAGLKRVNEHFRWDHKAEYFSGLYLQLAESKETKPLSH